MLSIDKEYRGRGIIKEAKNIIEKIISKSALRGMAFRTVIPEAFGKAGFVESEIKIMEG